MVTDEDGNERTFEIVDRYETEENTYYALSPLFEDKAEYLRYDGSMILVRAGEDEDGSYFDPIDDPAEYEAVYAAFEARLRAAEEEEEDAF